jgi:hypothetical protein
MLARTVFFRPEEFATAILRYSREFAAAVAWENRRLFPNAAPLVAVPPPALFVSA